MAISWKKLHAAYDPHRPIIEYTHVVVWMQGGVERHMRFGSLEAAEMYQRQHGGTVRRYRDERSLERREPA